MSDWFCLICGAQFNREAEWWDHLDVARDGKCDPYRDDGGEAGDA